MELNFKIKNKSDISFKKREENLLIFKKKGFPNKREEEWKFTDLEKILNDNFIELNNEKFEKNKPNIHKFNFNHNSIILLNGKLESLILSLKILRIKIL